jgi:hypothetical protein
MIHKWKNGAAQRCYKKLFAPISDENPNETYMSRILEKVWSDSDKASDISVAFAISVCETLLSPDSGTIQIKEEVLKRRLKRNLVYFANLCK